MAVDKTQKALNLASRTITATTKFMVALEDLLDLNTERSNGNIDLTDYDAEYLLHDNLKHVDGAMLNAVLSTSIPAIDGFMTGASHDDNLQRVRP